MLLDSVFDFVAKNRWVQWVLTALLVVFTLGLYLAWRDDGVRKRERQRQEVETAKERERVLATAREEVENVEDAKDAALAAPDTLPEFGSADELRAQAPAVAKVILRDHPRDGK
jgi:flagellar biosynthesis/type III secretory pathway M-ring protein FliF/YscJ